MNLNYTLFETLPHETWSCTHFGDSIFQFDIAFIIVNYVEKLQIFK